MVIPDAETEAALIAEAQSGNRNAYGELVRHHYQGVINVIYRMCGDVELAQDAAQDAFIQAWLHLPTFRPGTSLRNWLYRIAMNVTRSFLAARVRSPLEAAEMVGAPTVVPKSSIAGSVGGGVDYAAGKLLSAAVTGEGGFP